MCGGDGCDFSKNFDWIVLRNNNLIKNKITPITIYCDVHSLDFFSSNILEKIINNFTLITGCGDHLPQIHYKHAFDKIYQTKFLKLWYMENLAIKMEKCRSLPVGLASHSKEDEALLLSNMSNIQNIKKKNKIFICCYSRIGNNEIFTRVGCNVRETYKKYASEHPELFDVYDTGIPLKDYLNHLKEYKYALCPHGYGLDPNPTAWYSLALNTIPIVHDTVNSRCMFKDISDSVIYVKTPDEIKNSLSDRPPCFKDFLTAKYWSNKILSHSI